MARSFAMECPVTPERVDQCPATPDFIRRQIKSPESTSSSDESTFHNRVANGSPPPNCAICLGKCKNKCFTDSCLHQFCFKCLLEWSKVKAECPLCKQSFKSIIHNVKSDDQFEEYWVQSPSNMFPDFSRPMRAHIHLPSRSTVNAAIQSNTLSNSIIQLRSNIATRFRCYVYDGHLYASPLPDVTGRFRECSPRFYRENPAQIHRLMPWLNREIICLLRNTNYSLNTADSILEMIPHLLTVFNINSPDFRRRLAPFLGPNTTHFIHEFLNFARSPYDMIGYDREVRYAGNSNGDEVIINETSTSSDSDEVAEIAGDSSQLLTASQYNNRRQRNNPALGLTIETSNNPHSAVSTVHIVIADGDSNASNNSNLDTSNIPNQTSQLTAINLSTNNSSSILSNGVDDQINSELRILNETPIEITETNQSSREIIDDRISLCSSTSSDACEFVLERKPPHLRTPEMVSLNSDSDSDVVFISEEKRLEANTNNGPIPGTSGVSFSIDKQRRLRSSKMRNIKGIFMPSSDVDHTSDSDFKPSVEVRRLRIKKMKTRQSEKVIKSEYTAGPSTSSGITGNGKPMSLLHSSSSRDKWQKYKTSKFKNFRHRNERSYKTIYESSSSSESESSRNASDDDDHKSSSSDDHIDNVKKSLPNSNSATSFTYSSSGTGSSSSSSSCQSDKNKKFKNKTSNRNQHNSNIKGEGSRKSVQSSSSSSGSPFALKNKVNGSKNRSNNSSSDSSSSSTSSTEVSTSDSCSDGAHKSTSSNSENMKLYKSIRKNLLRAGKNCKIALKSKSDKRHSTGCKKDENLTKHNDTSKRNKKTKIKPKEAKCAGSAKRYHKSKKLKEKYRKRKLHRKLKIKSTTEFSASDTEPLSKHIKLCKTEPESCENVNENSEMINVQSEAALQPANQEEHQSLEQDRDPTSVLLCFPNNVYLSINLSTTEQIQSEQPLLPSANDNAQQSSLISEEQN